MYKEIYPFIEKPSNENVKIWRYVDYYPKYVNLLETNSLYFRRADLFKDTLEGTFPKSTFEIMKGSTMRRDFTSDTIEEIFQVMQNGDRVRYFVNCWHINDCESASMWELYTKESKAIVIQSTFKKLTQCFEIGTLDVNIGKVKYIDRENHEGLILAPMLFFHKDLPYKDETELRALISESPSAYTSDVLNDWKTGTLVKVNLETLIEKIYISPRAPEGFMGEIKSLMSKYNIDKPIESSSLLQNNR